MTPARFQLRAIVGLGVLLVAFAGLIVRLGRIQLGDHAELRRRGDNQHATARHVVPADRGAITDRHGRVLARTEQWPSIAVDPKWIRERDRKTSAQPLGELERLARIVEEEIGIDVRSIVTSADAKSQFVWVRRKIEDRDAVERMRVRLRKQKLRGVIIDFESVRTYPAGALAAHMVGFTFEGADGALRGAAGAERLGDARLRGSPGWRSDERDATGRRIVVAQHPGRAARHGQDIRLTLDTVIQAFAESEADEIFREFDPASVIAAVVDIRTGDLLAMACRPGFDANSRTAPQDVRRNRFFTDVFEPGSTFKPITMGIALDAGVVTVGEIIDTNPGTVQIGGRSIREDKHHNYGELTPAGAIAESSNVAMAKLALRLGVDRMHTAVRTFGFGAKTGVRWAGESRGIVTPFANWTETYTLCSVSFGQEIAVTPAQLLAAYAGLANDGLLHPLRVFLDEPAPAAVRVIRAEAARQLAPMMEAVFETGTASRIATGGYRMAGKTGTAEQKNKRGQSEYVGSFACFGPVEAPRLAVLVVCDRPQGSPYGSRVAAPFAARLLRNSLRYLGVPTSAPREDAASADSRVLDPSPEVQPR